MHVVQDGYMYSVHIGGGSRGAEGAMALLKFKALRRNSIFAIENHLNLAEWTPNFQ